MSSGMRFGIAFDGFVPASDAMAAAGERGDMTGVMGLMVDALPCKQGHDVYRARKTA